MDWDPIVDKVNTDIIHIQCMRQERTQMSCQIDQEEGNTGSLQAMLIDLGKT